MIDFDDEVDKDDEHISTSVYYHAKKEGCDDDEAERVARAIGEIRYNSAHERFKRWFLERLRGIGLAVTSLITGAAALKAEELINILKNFL